MIKKQKNALRKSTMIFQTEKQLKEFGDKLSEGNKSALNGALEKLKEAHKTQDVAAIDNAMTALNNAWQAASQEMYAAQGANAGPNANANAGATDTTGANAGNGNTATDVEYEEVK
jgi:molecular chaperone DnaK